MDLTQSELRLIQRHRTVAHRVFRIARNLLALCGLAFVVSFFWMTQTSRNARHAYDAQARDLQAQTVQETSASAPMTIRADSYSTYSDLVRQHTAKYDEVLDSLELLDKELGFMIYIAVMPMRVKGLRSCTSELGYFTTACGCEEDTLDYNVFGLEKNFQHARVTSSQKVTLAEYKTQNRHTSGPRR